MIGNKQLALRFAAAVAVASLAGASAFAESRPVNETRGSIRDRVVERNAERSRSQSGDVSRNRARAAQSSIEVRGNRESAGRSTAGRGAASRSDASRRTGGRIERDRTPQNRGDATVRRGDSQRNSGTYRDRSDRDRNNGDRNRSRDNGTWRDSSRNNDSRSRGTYRDSRYRNDSRSSRYGNRAPFRHSGRVHRVYPYGGGYRVWLTGCNYPFYVPSSYYNRSRFRVGLTIALGGFYNSRGYYEYYDGYDDGYYDSRTSRGELRGIVESVDYRRETFVVRNEASGSFVTVIMRDRGRDPVRAGDYVELGGDWTRSGLFEAYRVDIVDYERRR